VKVSRKNWKSYAAFAVTLAFMLAPHLAMAAAAAGGGMPYSGGLTTFRTSVTGEIAGILIVIAIVGGVGLWIFGGQLDGLMQTIVRVVIGGCIVGGVTAFMAAVGMTGAII
jgi:type IV secretory pathway VirB2 component (pilin)